MSDIEIPRRRFFARATAAASALVLSGCDRLSRTQWFPRVLAVAELWNHGAARAVTPRTSMAQEFAESDRSPQFRSNGTSNPGTDEYQAMAANGFADYRLAVAGMVRQPMSFSLAELRALPERTQITRHDCVEGWSAIAKWKGVKLSAILDAVKPAPGARYVMFYCADPMEADGTDFYYESIDLDDAYHPQTILAYEMNDAPLPVPNGAPLRLRVERQLGYKHAKYVTAIALVDGFGNIAGGKGGYWEDNGYQWFAGI
ncbi:MAG TPA: molybdopterin-binding protein [Casimicrobiaceae bacterium]|nr:molybdopterin-binding protein [Casimicrobiaceae bacterium]